MTRQVAVDGPLPKQNIFLACGALAGLQATSFPARPKPRWTRGPTVACLLTVRASTPGRLKSSSNVRRAARSVIGFLFHAFRSSFWSDNLTKSQANYSLESTVNRGHCAHTHKPTYVELHHWSGSCRMCRQPNTLLACCIAWT